MSGAVLTPPKPHYVRDYQKLVQKFQRDFGNNDEAFERAVGGYYIHVGEAQADLVRQVAPEGPFRMIDVGCGAGRAAFALRDESRISYLGIDVVAELLQHAEKKAGRPDWRFEKVSTIEIPAADASADLLLIMSVFTHLTPREINTYLGECARVLKPGGAVIASYLERNNPEHKSLYYKPIRNRISRLIGRDVMVRFTTEDELAAWFRNAGLIVERAIDNARVGQHVLIGRKPSSHDNAEARTG